MKKLLLIISLFSMISTFAQSILPAPDHIVIVILENHPYTQIIGSPSAAFINAFASDSNSALFTNSYAIEHPSQPNYLDFYSGCNQGVTNNDIPSTIPFTTANLGRQLIDSGKTFITYAEDLPSVGFNGATAGRYVRKHNPAANWMGTGINQIPETTNQPFTEFSSTNFSQLPTVCYVIPNLDNDMHDGSITTGDNWVYDNFSGYIEWAKTNNSLFILTFDEDNNTTNNQIATIITGQTVRGGQYSEMINHYNILRTIEDMYGLPFACNTSNASTISDCWTTPDGVSNNQIVISMYPNPARNYVTLKINLRNNLKLAFMNVLGENVKDVLINSAISNIRVDEFTSGLYLYQLKSGTRIIEAGKIMIE